MKKKFFFAAVALVMSAATAVGYKAYDKGNMSEFMMANIEALTSGEFNETTIDATCKNIIPYYNCFYICDCGMEWLDPEYGKAGKLTSISGSCTCGRSAHL